MDNTDLGKRWNGSIKKDNALIVAAQSVIDQLLVSNIEWQNEVMHK